MLKSAVHLEPAQLCRHADLSRMGFETTDDLVDITGAVGQARAVEAIRFGTGMKNSGFNIYALGPSGLEKRDLVQQFFESQAEAGPTPPDWCYVHNFAQEHRPLAIQLPSGLGKVLHSDMEALVLELQTVLSAAFESEEYQSRHHAISEEFRERQAEEFEELQERAGGENAALIRTPSGIAVAPTRDGEVLTPEQIYELPAEEQQVLEDKIEVLQQDLQRILRQVPGWQRGMRERLSELNREMADLAVGALIDELRERYAHLPEVIAHLDAVQEDVVANAAQFLPQQGSDTPGAVPAMQQSRGHSLRRYSINVLIDHSEMDGAPVIYENNPTYQNLLGRVEHRAQMGALMTDFTLIKPGALHRANGGYLILDVRSLLTQGAAWEALKRALKSREIRMESLGQQLSVMSTVSLEPEPIPLVVKVALIGDRRLYYPLLELDPEFGELFKVAADFDDQMAWDDENQVLYARLIGTLARREKLLPFDRTAVERLLVQSARLVADSEKLSTRMRGITDLMLEADYWAREGGREVVSLEHVQQAIDAQIGRMSRIREHSQEAMSRKIKLIGTGGAVVGQINGLSVLTLSNFAFGQPTRITARTSLGRGQVVDIEREVELGGPLHSKGMMILTGFLTGRYAQEQPLSLSASLVFEQSYGGVDGDSASSAELYALLSAIAEVPIKQSFAVTGSVNQNGEVQAIGGVNEKVEGFFDVCKAQGLTGEQGVLIPHANVQHLMLRQDVVDAVTAGEYHVYAVEHIDQGIETLTGMPAGLPDAQGIYPEETINGKVQRRLRAMAERLQAFGKPVGEDAGERR
jgi:predicted ATP-dependent protease